MSKLFDERVVAVQPSLVRAVGSVTVAAVAQQIHYHAEYGHTIGYAGEQWVKRTYEELAGEIGLTGEQVRRAVNKLEASGTVIVCQPEGHVRTKWYRLDYDSPALSETSNRQNGRLETAKPPIASGRIATSSSIKNQRDSDGIRAINETHERMGRAAARTYEENAKAIDSLDDFKRPELPEDFFDKVRTGAL